MPAHKREVRSNLFTLRVWLEQVDDGREEWRGRVQHVVSGETIFFRDWDTLLAFLRGEVRLSQDAMSSTERESSDHSDRSEEGQK